MTLPLSKEQIEAIQARAEKATPGPWESDSVKSEGSYGAGDETQEGYDAFKIVAEIRGKSLSICDSLNSEEGEVHEDYGEDESGQYHSAWDEIARRNFDFIAHARTNIPALCHQALRAIELEAEVARLQNLVPHLCENAEMQSYTGTVEIMPPEAMRRSAGHGICVDVCLALEVTRLWSQGIKTTGCCCGHGRQHGYIGVTDECIPAMQALGYQVIVRPEAPERLDSFYPKTKLVNYEQLQSDLTATRKALEEATADACDEEIVAAITEEPMATRTPSRIVHYLKKHGLKIVRALPSPQVEG